MSQGARDGDVTMFMVVVCRGAMDGKERRMSMDVGKVREQERKRCSWWSYVAVPWKDNCSVIAPALLYHLHPCKRPALSSYPTSMWVMEKSDACPGIANRY